MNDNTTIFIAMLLTALGAGGILYNLKVDVTNKILLFLWFSAYSLSFFIGVISLFYGLKP